MTPTVATIIGVLKQDGTLELPQPIGLPPGPVEVTVKRVEDAKPDTLTVLQGIWAELDQSSAPRRTKEEIDAYVLGLRDELEEHILAAEELQRSIREGRDKPPC